MAADTEGGGGTPENATSNNATASVCEHLLKAHRGNPQNKSDSDKSVDKAIYMAYLKCLRGL